MFKYLLLSAVLLASSIQPLSAKNGGRDVPKLSLSAEATIKKPADELRMRVGVVTVAETAEEALSENSVRMEAVIKGLTDAGLSKGDYETGHFSINPTYTPYPKNPPPDWRQTINGYEVRNTIQIHTSAIDSAGKWIDVANKAGANTIENIHFALSEPRMYSDEAVSTAIGYAIHDAEIIAREANVKLVQILSITVDNSYVSQQPNNLYMAKASYGDSAPPIEAGDVTLTARVSLSYEISSNSSL